MAKLRLRRYKIDIDTATKEFQHAGKTAKKWGERSPALMWSDKFPFQTKFFMKLELEAQIASGDAPLGPGLGLYGIPIIAFLDRFNRDTKAYKPGTKLSARLRLSRDGRFHVFFRTPLSSYMLLKLLDYNKGSGNPGFVINKKYLYSFYKKFRLFQLNDKLYSFFLNKNLFFKVNKLYRYFLKYKFKKRINKYKYLEKQRKRYLKKMEKPKKKGKKKKLKQKKMYKKLNRKQRKALALQHKYKNVAGLFKFGVITPEMVYEICLLKYKDFENFGSYYSFLSIDPKKIKKLTYGEKVKIMEERHTKKKVEVKKKTEEELLAEKKELEAASMTFLRTFIMEDNRMISTIDYNEKVKMPFFIDQNKMKGYFSTMVGSMHSIGLFLSNGKM